MGCDLVRAVGGVAGDVSRLEVVGRIPGGDSEAAFEDREVLAAAGGMGVGGELGVGREGQFVDLVMADAFGGGEDADGDAVALDHG